MSTTVTTNTLPSNVLKLNVSRKNWAIYRIRFTHAVQSKGVWSHLEGTATKPVAIGTTPPDAAELVTWLKDESIALDLLTQWIPDSTVIRTASQTDAAAMWKEIVCEYT
jgi:hypothetical protein